MSTLVTGGTGFLGRRLVERLVADGRDVVVLARNPSADLSARGVRFFRTSLDDVGAVRAACADVETVFHVAARVGVRGRYDDFFRTNVLGTRALLAGCRQHGVKRLVYTSTPSVVYNGRDLADADERLPLTTHCPSPYPLTKAIAEREVLAAHSPSLHTIALRPHLIWGVGDPHLVPRLLDRARSGRLRIIGRGDNLVDMVHIENAVDAHLLAETALSAPDSLPAPGPAPRAQSSSNPSGYSTIRAPAGGRAFFITNGEPVALWDWINGLLNALDQPAITKSVSLGKAQAMATVLESAWRLFSLKGEPPLTRFVAAELAKDHWFNIDAARRDLGYEPRVSMMEGTTELVAHLRRTAASRT